MRIRRIRDCRNFCQKFYNKSIVAIKVIYQRVYNLLWCNEEVYFYTKTLIIIPTVSSISYKSLFFGWKMVKCYCIVNKYMVVYLS